MKKLLYLLLSLATYSSLTLNAMKRPRQSDALSQPAAKRPRIAQSLTLESSLGPDITALILAKCFTVSCNTNNPKQLLQAIKGWYLQGLARKKTFGNALQICMSNTGKTLDTIIDMNDNSTLHLACRQGDLNCVKIILHATNYNPFKLIRLTDQFGDSALHYAAINGTPALFSTMFNFAKEHEAEFIQLICLKNMFGKTAVDSAAENGNLWAVQKALLHIICKHLTDHLLALIEAGHAIVSARSLETPHR
jgi:ankyrin repeat protein